MRRDATSWPLLSLILMIPPYSPSNNSGQRYIQCELSLDLRPYTELVGGRNCGARARAVGLSISISISPPEAGPNCRPILFLLVKSSGMLFSVRFCFCHSLNTGILSRQCNRTGCIPYRLYSSAAAAGDGRGGSGDGSVNSPLPRHRLYLTRISVCARMTALGLCLILAQPPPWCPSKFQGGGSLFGRGRRRRHPVYHVGSPTSRYNSLRHWKGDFQSPSRRVGTLRPTTYRHGFIPRIHQPVSGHHGAGVTQPRLLLDVEP